MSRSHMVLEICFDPSRKSPVLVTLLTFFAFVAVRDYEESGWGSEVEAEGSLVRSSQVMV